MILIPPKPHYEEPMFFSLCVMWLCWCCYVFVIFTTCDFVTMDFKDSGKLARVNNQNWTSWGARLILWLCFHAHLVMFVIMWPLRLHCKEPKRVTIFLSGTNIICCCILLNILKCHDDLKHFHQPFHLIVWIAHFLRVKIFKHSNYGCKQDNTNHTHLLFGKYSYNIPEIFLKNILKFKNLLIVFY